VEKERYAYLYLQGVGGRAVQPGESPTKRKGSFALKKRKLGRGVLLREKGKPFLVKKGLCTLLKEGGGPLL